MRLHNVHPVFRNGVLVGFAACASSRVEITSLSPFATASIPFHRPSYREFDRLYSRMNVCDASFMLSSFLAIRDKMGHSLSSRQVLGSASVSHPDEGLLLRLLGHCVNTNNTPDLLASLFDHSLCAIANDTCRSAARSPLLPTVAQLLASPEIAKASQELDAHARSPAGLLLFQCVFVTLCCVCRSFRMAA